MVGKLRSNADKSIGRVAAEVVNKWKKSVEAEKAKKAGRGQGSSPVASPTAAASPAPPPAAKSSKPWTGDASKRRWESDGVDKKRTGSMTRDNCIGLLYNALAYMSYAPIDDILIKAIEVEQAAFKVHNGETPDYRSTMRMLSSNLKQNRELAKHVFSGDIPANELVVMSSDELKSADLKKKEEALAKENMKKAQVPMVERSISDALECSKCKQKKVSYTQAQTRSADEPMTTFCECTVCGNRWKVCATSTTQPSPSSSFSQIPLPPHNVRMFGCLRVGILESCWFLTTHPSFSVLVVYGPRGLGSASLRRRHGRQPQLSWSGVSVSAGNRALRFTPPIRHSAAINRDLVYAQSHVHQGRYQKVGRMLLLWASLDTRSSSWYTGLGTLCLYFLAYFRCPPPASRLSLFPCPPRLF